jgi:DNA-binding MarR family transcriptional regulator
VPKKTGRDISLLFDLFAVHQRVSGLVGLTLDGAELRGDEYAVYSVLFDLGPLTATEMAANLGMPLTTVLDYVRVMERRKHIHRVAHPTDGRARQIRLSPEGLAAHRRANAAWERMAQLVDAALGTRLPRVRASLHDLDDAVIAAEGKMRGKAARAR